MQKAKCQSGGKWAFQRESCRKYQSSLEVIRIRNTWILDHFKTQVTNQVVKVIKMKDKFKQCFLRKIHERDSN